ncbi:MAG TPA: aspartyl/asparaginyl beta-hydroxylase domain-containing protein [Burkholderiaceae bacterium]
MQAFLRLPFDFDPAALLRDLRTCEALSWPAHFHAEDYSGSWTSIALRSASGTAGDIRSHPGSGYRDTELLTRCPYFRQLLRGFACELESVRLLNLAPGSVIKEHCDPFTAYRHGVFRIHVPLATSEDVHFLIGGQRLAMRAGECWYGDFSLPHSVENRGAAARVNLVIDGKRNVWSDDVFARAGYDFAAEADAMRPDAATRERMIAELRLIGTEAAHKLILSLQ